MKNTNYLALGFTLVVFAGCDPSTTVPSTDASPTAQAVPLTAVEPVADPTPASTPVITPTPTVTASAVPSPSPTASAVPSPSPTASAVPSPSPSPSVSPSASPSPSPTPTNHAPTISPIDHSGAEASALSFNLNGADSDNDTLTYSCLSSCPAGLSVDSASGSVTWTPNYGQAGTYSPVFKVIDPGSLSDQKTVTLTITHTNRSPVINPITAQSVSEGSTLTISPVCSDPDNDTLTLGTSGSLPANSSFASGSFSFAPDYTQQGQYSVVLTCSDGQATVQQSVTITVNYTDRPPVMAPVSDVTASQQQAISFSVSATQPDNNTLTYSITGAPSGSSFSNQQFTWTPACNTAGIYNVTFGVTDGTLNDSKSMVITVNATNCFSPTWNSSFPPSLSGTSGNSTNAFIGSGADLDIGDTLSYVYVANYDCNNKAWTHSFNASTKTLALTNSFGSSDPGTHSFLVYVTDSAGHKNYRFVQVMGYGGSFSVQKVDLGATFSTTGLCGAGTVYTH